MRLEKRNLVLGTIALVLLLLELASSGSGPERRGAVLGSFDPAAAGRVRIEADGASVTLERRRDAWTVAERGGFPAHAASVLELLGRLAALDGSDLVAREQDSHARYGVGPDAPRLVVEDDDGRALVDARVGRPADEARGSYLSFADDDDVYRAPGIPALDADPVRWLETRLLELDGPSVQGVRIQKAGEDERHLVRSEDGRWRDTKGAGSVAPREIDPLLLVAGATYLEDVLVDADPGEPVLTLRFELEGGSLLLVELGGELEGGRAVRRPEWSGAFVGRIRARTAANLEGAVELVLRSLE